MELPVSTETMPTAAKVPSMKIRPERAWARPRRGETATAGSGRSWYFIFFFTSGFCSILYELIWLRLAMAQFGVTTAMVSIVLSSFMAGLGVGSLGSGHLLRWYSGRFTSSPLRLYAIAVFLVGCSAVIVPFGLRGRRFLLAHVGNSLLLASSGYYLAAGLWLECSLIPWCSCMRATIPLGMSAV